MSVVQIGQYYESLGGYVFDIESDGSNNYALIAATQNVVGASHVYNQFNGVASGHLVAQISADDISTLGSLSLQLVSTMVLSGFNPADINANDTTITSGSINFDLFVAYANTLTANNYQGYSGISYLNSQFNGAGVAGKDDWFLPNRVQLETLIKMAHQYSLIDVLELNEQSETFGEIYFSSTEGTSQATEVYAVNVNNSTESYAATTSYPKTGWGKLRPIRRQILPASVSITDIDGTSLTNNSYLLENIATDITTAVHDFVIGATTRPSPIWYCSHVKFTSLETNTAAAVFGNIPSLISVEYTDYAANGTPSYIYYKDSSFTSTLTALTDGGVYRITTGSRTQDYTLSVEGDIITTSSGSFGFDFSIISGYSHMPWLIPNSIPIDSLFHQGNGSPDVTTQYEYTIAYTADLALSSWGSRGLVGTDNANGEENTELIVSILGIATAANLSSVLSNTVSGTTYTDWFLPSKQEMAYMFSQSALLASHPLHLTSNYWSSSEDGSKNAWSHSTLKPGGTSSDRRGSYKSRPTRKVISTSSVNLGSLNFGGVVIKKTNLLGSAIEEIRDDNSNSWSPNATDNTLTMFTSSKGYYIKTTSAFTFTETFDVSSARGALPSQAYDSFPAITPSVEKDVMYFEITAQTISDAIRQVNESAEHPSISNLIISLVNLFASQEAAIMTFKNSYGISITHQTMMGTLDTHSSSAIYNHARYKVHFNSKFEELKIADNIYKVGFVSAANVFIGGTTRYISENKLESKVYNFPVERPSNAGGVVYFTIYTNPEYAGSGEKRFRIKLEGRDFLPSIPFTKNKKVKIKEVKLVT